MAAKTRIKHLTSSGVLAPTILKTGEIGYSYGTGTQSNKGDRLFIGIGAEDSNGIASEIVEVGGQYFTDLLDHAHGSLQADSALITDSASKLAQLKVDNLDLNGNTISSLDTNGNIILDPNGVGKTVLHNPYINGTTDSLEEFIYDTVGGAVTAGTGITVTNDDAGNSSTISITDTITAATNVGGATTIPIISYNAQGQLTAVSTASVATALTVDGDTGTENVNLLTDDLQILGTTNEIAVAVTKVGTDVKATVSLPDDVTIGSDLTVTDNLTVNGNVTLGNATSDTVQTSGNLTVGGNLTVSGTTTSVNSTETTLTDPMIELAKDTSSADGLDRGVRFKWHDGSAVKDGFFGFDIQTERFSFTKDEDLSGGDNASTPWHDAQFGEIYATKLTTSSGNLVLDSANGLVDINDNVDISGSLVLGTDLAVAHGGTGVSSFTANAVFISNGSGTALSFVTGTEGKIIQFNSSGVPVASEIIDGGTY